MIDFTSNEIHLISNLVAKDRDDKLPGEFSRFITSKDKVLLPIHAEILRKLALAR